MPLAEGWYVDGVALEDYGRVIEDRSGWDDTPAVRGENTLLLGRHGAAWRRKKFEPGRKTLTMSLHGVNADGTLPVTGRGRRIQYEAALDGLLRLVGQRERLLDVKRVHADGTSRRADCEVINAILPSDVRDDFGRVQFELVVPGSFWEDTDPLSYVLPYDGGGDDEQTVEVFSLAGQTAPCADPIVRIDGPFNAISVRDAITGSGFSYGGTIGSDDHMIVDAGEFTAVEYDEVDLPTNRLMDLDLFDGQLLEISAAPKRDVGPSLIIDVTAANTDTKITVTTRRKWLR